MVNTSFAVYVGIVYSYLPFMVLPLYANLEKHDRALLEAAADLGAPPWKAFLRVTLPLSMPGVMAGALLVFIPAVGEYVIPSLLGSANQLMIGRVLSDEFFENRDWPVASAVAILMLIAAARCRSSCSSATAAASSRPRHEVAPDAVVADGAGIRICVSVPADPVADRVFVQCLAPGHGLGCGAFADAQVVSRAVPQRQILGAAWLSLRIAAMNATGAVILGTLAGFALARFGRFRGRALLAALTHRAAGDAGDHHRPVAAAAVRGLEQLIGWPAHAASPPSRWRTSVFRSPTWR